MLGGRHQYPRRIDRPCRADISSIERRSDVEECCDSAVESQIYLACPLPSTFVSVAILHALLFSAGQPCEAGSAGMKSASFRPAITVKTSVGSSLRMTEALWFSR